VEPELYWLFASEEQLYRVTALPWNERDFKELMTWSRPHYEPVEAFEDRAIALAEASALNSFLLG